MQPIIRKICLHDFENGELISTTEKRKYKRVVRKCCKCYIIKIIKEWK